jgi:hypothetical protein
MTPLAGRPDVDVSWHPQAACNHRRHPEVLPQWFAPLDYTPPGPPELEPVVRRALAVCASCSMTERCREQADRDPYAQGVWSGRYRSNVN